MGGTVADRAATPAAAAEALGRRDEHLVDAVVESEAADPNLSSESPLTVPSSKSGSGSNSSSGTPSSGCHTLSAQPCESFAFCCTIPSETSAKKANTLTVLLSSVAVVAAVEEAVSGGGASSGSEGSLAPQVATDVPPAVAMAHAARKQRTNNLSRLVVSSSPLRIASYKHLAVDAVTAAAELLSQSTSTPLACSHGWSDTV
ncbi:hypothetical protein Vafri_20922 [Volvox africanus]|uniref:Uncharacterized protein n=1 Tax=Volvox africanus TaxID=51714 RepID=A0A8J4FDL1_9CHLO|nr:hypothetical protein Vafri_20922 [Volvox africanus]